MKSAFAALFGLLAITARVAASAPDCLSHLLFKDDGTLESTTCIYTDPKYGTILFGVQFSTSAPLSLDTNGKISDVVSFRRQIKSAYLVRKAELDGYAKRETFSAPKRARVKTPVLESDLK